MAPKCFVHGSLQKFSVLGVLECSNHIQCVFPQVEVSSSQVWSKYSRELIELSEPERIDDAISCLNELITNALLHIPDVMKYLSRIQNQSIFNFFAILQVSYGRRLRGTGGRSTPPNLRWGHASAPPNILRNAVIGCEAKYELAKNRSQGQCF